MTFLLDIRKISFWSFLFVLGLYPYLFLINMVIPNTLPWGKNTYISAITAIIIIIFLLQWKAIFRCIPMWSLFLFIFLTTNIALLNLLFYSSIKHIEILRIPLNLVIYLGVAYSLTRDISSKKIIYNIILYNCVIQAIVGIIHYIYFPYIMTGLGGSGLPYLINKADPTPQAERGLLGNPNVYSLFLLLGCFLLIYRDKAFKKKWIVETIYLFLLITGIVLSNSRFGLIFSMILFFVYFMKSPVKKKVILASLAIIGIITFYGFMEQRIGHVYHRTFLRSNDYAGDYFGRTSRNINALNLVVSDWSSVLIGPSQEKTYEFKVVEGNRYSDNSFFLLLHNYGLPAALVIVLVMFFLYSKMIAIKKWGTILFLIYFIAALYVYNSILFDIWLLFFSASLMVLSRKSDKQDRLLSYGS